MLKSNAPDGDVGDVGEPTAPEAPAPRAGADASRPPVRPLEARVGEAIELLEQLGGDLRALAQLDEPLRIRLVTAAGQLSRPDRYSRKALGKVLARQRVRARRDADRTVLDQTGIRALRKEPVFRTPLPRPAMPLDAPVRDDGEPDAWAQAEALRAEGGPRSAPRVENPRLCYVCKTEFHELHHFYDQMCPPCAEHNYRKREQTADLRGRIALVTGGRVKIGYQAAMKLLRAGAEVIVATRFPRDAARRFAREPDASDWIRRLHVYGIDLRHTPSVELFCQHLLATLPRLDALINNACQTVRRPAGWYDHVIAGELDDVSRLPAAERTILARNRALGEQGRATGGAAASDRSLATTGARDSWAPTSAGEAVGAGNEIRAAGLWKSAVLAQVPLLAEDLERGNHLYPAGRLDADLQQVDLRDFNSWRMTLAEVPTAELLEVHLVNAVAPFVLNARLRPLLAAVPTRDAHVVNVSAMEGQFYRRWKTDKHPHTNMAKAALNMMTRTSAIDYVRDGIHMNSVDTGWVTDEDPAVHAARKTQIHGFHPPLDIVDGAARIVDPVFDGVTTGDHLWGLFLKDYKPAPW
ncbi:MAG TPA: SDR family NAD(P)-dependent oxidoreductase [Kofleriaceae bacterium]|nr:SDR family NAD(P)-dependent oxidoreductase [Kofleriaceae bacterium]